MPKPKSMSRQASPEPSGTLPPLDPIIEGLLEKLPEPGDIWPKADRQRWIALLQATVDLIYKDEPPKPQ